MEETSTWLVKGRDVLYELMKRADSNLVTWLTISAKDRFKISVRWMEYSHWIIQAEGGFYFSCHISVLTSGAR